MSTCTYTTAPRPFRVELRPHGKYQRYCAVLSCGTERFLQRVTTILSTLNKEALIPWAVGETLKACREKIQPGCTYSEDQLERVWEWAKDAQYRTKQEAAAYGTRAHELIEAYLHSGAAELPNLSNEAPAVRNCFALFEEYWQTQRLTVVDLEVYVADLALGYGGTLDCLARRPDGSLVLLDWKTSKAVYPEYHLQVVAYGGAMASMGLGMPETASIVRIGKEDAEFETVTAWENLEQARTLYHAWKHLVHVAAWLKEAKAKSDAEWRKKKRQKVEVA